VPKHAYLAASASERWLACPPSAKLCAEAEDQGSRYAQEGSDAHTLCQYLVEKALGYTCRDPTEDLGWYNTEMQECAEAYCAFVMEQVEEAKKLCADPLICVEQTLDFSKWVEHGFGTGDCVIVADDLLQIIDFKYGEGHVVTAAGENGTGNPQLSCYALGAIDTFGDLYDIRRVKLTIFQPRRDNVDSFETTKDALLDWAENTLAPIARLAYNGEGEFRAGDHCRFCRVKGSCRARAEYAMELAKYDFAEAPTLSADEISAILPMVDTLTKWAEDIKSFALAQALSGIRYPGFKLVEGKSNRKYTNEAEVARIVTEAGYDAYEKKLLGITAMTKQLGRKQFDTLLKGLVEKPHGKPELVPDSDKRPEYSSAKTDFTED